MFTESLLPIVSQSVLAIGFVVFLVVLVRLMLAATVTLKTITHDREIRLDLLLAEEGIEPE